MLRRTLYAKLALLFALFLVAGIGYLRLVAGPVSLNDYTRGVGEALAARIGPGWKVGFNDAALELDGLAPAVRAEGLEIRNPVGVAVVKAPLAYVSVDFPTLLTGNVALRAIELRDLQLRVLVGRDGSLAFLPQGESDAAASPPVATPITVPEKTTRPDASPVSQALASLLEPVLAPNGVVGALDRAAITNARLTLVGADGRERVGFSRVGARFEQLGQGKRQIAIDLDGPHGNWRIGGTAQDDGGGNQGVELHVSDVPVADVFLLAGLSGLPEGTDLKLSADVAASLKDRALSSLRGRFSSSRGVIELPDKDLRFLHLDGIAGIADWDEARRAFLVRDMTWSNGPTQIKLAAELKLGSEPRSWTMAFSGRDAVLSGATDTDKPVKVGSINGYMTFQDGVIGLEKLAVTGDELDVSLAGSFDPNKRELRADVRARHTAARSLLRLWPQTINPPLRTYLATSISSGIVESLNLASFLNPADLKAAFGAEPVSDGAVKLDFTLSDGRLVAANGLPAISQLAMDGTATGTSALVNGRQGRVDLPEGRNLLFSEASYRHLNMTTAGSTAQIAFRLSGGADALAGLLRLPAFREASAIDIEPSAVKGRADLRVSVPLQLDNLPKTPADVPVAIRGVLGDLAVDKVAGREKLEAGTFAVAVDPGGINIKGDAKLSGLPAAIEVKQAKRGPGELSANLILDDAARQRRSLPTAPQVTGPVTVRIVAPFGGPEKVNPHIEADLARAAVEGALPGWTKPIGKPGRASFTYVDGPTPELRDFALDSGSVQLRGTLFLTGEGGLDRAELSSVKLSPGDEMRAQVDRTDGGLTRVSLKGNVGDARPLIKFMTAPPKGGQRGAAGAGGSDLDLDLALNIMTGFNDEAMTGVAAKLSSRKGDLRGLQFSGRFRGAAVEASLGREARAPVLSLRSADAGATLRFLDIYKRMIGGKLALNAALADTSQTGTITINEFGLKDEPALRRIASQQPQSSISDEHGGQLPRFDVDQVGFTKLEAAFQRSQGRIDFKDVVIYGQQVGFTLSGYLDQARDRTDISGTFVPVYGLNNAFSQVPIVGLILGGGNRNEGLFAVDFRISGQASSPTLSVNPLSAVAPGILRKFFGWAMPDGDVPTGTTTPRNLER